VRKTFVAGCAALALVAAGGSSARLAATITLQRGGAYLYGNLGCVYPAPTAAAPEPVVYCGEWNYKHPVPGSYVFAGSAGYLTLMRFTRGKLQPVQTFAQPEGGAPPHLLTQLPSIVKVPGVIRVGYGAQARFEGLPLLANNLKTASGKAKLAGLIDIDSSGAARDGSHIAELSPTEADVVKFTKGVGTTEEVQEKPPKATPRLDDAAAEVEQALRQETFAVADLQIRKAKAALKEIEDARHSLKAAGAIRRLAQSAGEMSLDEGIQIAIDIDLANDGDYQALKKLRADEPAAVRRYLGKAETHKRAALADIAAAKKRAASLR
jgi:hypothetical protein